MKKIFFIGFLLSLLISIEAFSIDSLKVSKKTLFLANVSVAENIENLSDYKIEAALSLAIELSNKYRFLSTPEIDSLLKANQLKEDLTAIQIAKKLKIEKILFLSINRLANMLRVELKSVLTRDEKKVSNGIGYAQLNYKDTLDNFIYDAALLLAIQRAFASSENSPNLYADLEGKLIAYPAEPLIIGGIEFQNNKNLPEWHLFNNNAVNSYFAAQTIFEIAKETPRFAVYDLESRDSIYALFNLHIIENYRPPTSYELDALNTLEVTHYITGTFIRNEEGANIELYLCHITKKRLEVIRIESEKLLSDSMEEFSKKLRAAAERLVPFN
ncbi:MAG: hypothetical protein GX121_09520 [Ignavibacteria bacterium]|nr:hypothetical protein [Ignavibacteria bacterium]